MRRLLPFTLAAALLGGCTTTTTGPQTSDKQAAEFNVQLGYAYLRKGDLNLAKEKIERAEQQDPNNPAVQSALGVISEHLGELKEADKHYQAALRLAPKDPDISNNYAIFLCKNGRADEGVKRFEDAARNPLYRTPEAAFTNAGVCQRRADDLIGAEQNFLRALRVRPNFAEAAWQLGDLRLKKGDVEGAGRDLDAFLGTFPATPDLMLLRVQVARAAGDRLTEEKYARRLRVDYPDSPQTRSLAEPRKPG